MNPLPPNADELVSAYLDGHAAPDEVIIVESNPELMARVDALRQVTAQLGAPVVPAPEVKEAHLAAALGAFDALFADTPAIADTGGAQLAAAADEPSAHEPSVHEPPVTGVQPGVTSLDAARERRRPRRFNTGVIAAAAAALLLIVGFTALSLGRGGSSQSSDVASGISAAEVQSSADSSTDSADEAMDDVEETMDAEEEPTEDTSGGLSGVDADASGDAASASVMPAPTLAPQPPAAAAAEDDAAADDEAMSDTDGAASADEQPVEVEALDLEVTPFFFGQFESRNALRSEITDLSRLDLELRKDGIAEGIFARCQSAIPELAAIESPTLIGDAEVRGEPREIHALTTSDEQTVFYVIDPQDCSVILRFP